MAVNPPPDHSLSDRTFPYRTSYEDENGQRINFTYHSRIPEKLVFFATSNEPKAEPGALCVKFTRRYSEDAHRFLAGLGHAPQLRVITSLPGGWMMVIMDC